MKRYLSHTIFTSLLMLSLFTSALHARQLPDFTKLVDEYGSAVVNISTTAKKEEKKSQSRKELFDNLPKDGPFSDFFRHFFEDGSPFSDGIPQFQDKPSTSLGSGFIISADGYIVTNHHVVDNAEEIIVRLTDRREFVAELIGADERSDLALIKVSSEEALPVVKLGTSKDLKVGEWVLAIGSPFGFDHSVTAGIVSAKGRSLSNDNSYIPFIQTDVAINMGNSGGPLFNLDGEVIGVNSVIYSKTGGFMGLSFSIPVDLMKSVIDQLKADGKVSRGWLGILIQDVTRDLAESFGMEKPQGALIAKVLPDSPAEKAGFQIGDIIIDFNGKEVDHSSDLPPIVGMTEVGKTVPTKVVRNGKEVIVKVTIAELPPEEELKLAAQGDGQPNSVKADKLGLKVSDLTQEEREANNFKEEDGGVIVVSVENDSPAQSVNIQKGDIITQLNNTKIENAKQFEELVKTLQAGQAIALLIHRDGSSLFLALKIAEDKK